MYSVIPEELQILFSSEDFNNLLNSIFEKIKIYNKKYLENLDKEQIDRLFKSFLTVKYNSIENDLNKEGFFISINKEIVLYSLVKEFMASFVISNQSDFEMREHMAMEQKKLRKLCSYMHKRRYIQLDKFNYKIAAIIEQESEIMEKAYRIDFNELITLVKCYIVKELYYSNNPYDIMKQIENDNNLLTEMVLNAFSIYLNGIKNMDERRLRAKVEKNKVNQLFNISSQDGYFRQR